MRQRLFLEVARWTLRWEDFQALNVQSALSFPVSPHHPFLCNLTTATGKALGPLLIAKS